MMKRDSRPGALSSAAVVSAAAVVVIVASAIGCSGSRADQSGPPAQSTASAPATATATTPTGSAPAADAHAHPFHGKVLHVDVKGKLLTVAGDDVQGWMPAMTMAYAVDDESVFASVKPGDAITATVLDGDFEVLHHVAVVPAAGASPAPPPGQ